LKWWRIRASNLEEKNLLVEQKSHNSKTETLQTLAEYGREQVAPSRSKDSLAALVNTFITGKNTFLRKKVCYRCARQFTRTYI